MSRSHAATRTGSRVSRNLWSATKTASGRYNLMPPWWAAVCPMGQLV